MKKFLNNTAIQMVGWAARNDCGRIELATKDRSFAESFPWFNFVEFVKSKCEELSIVLDADASGGEVDETNEVGTGATEEPTAGSCDSAS